MVNLFVFLLDITLILNILQKLIKILHGKSLKATNLYSLHNDESVKNNELNDCFTNLKKWKRLVRPTVK